MSNSKGKDSSQPPKPPSWKGRDSLELVYQLNERAFTLLKESAIPHGVPWAELDVAAARRAARFPFLVVDIRFSDEGWWRSVLENRQGFEAAAQPGLWTAEAARTLMSEVLVFAWHTARWDRHVAHLLLGMVPPVVEVVRALTPNHLEAVSRLHAGALQLRWQHDEAFWQRLIQGARDGAEEALADIHLHAKLLLSGELMTRPISG